MYLIVKPENPGKDQLDGAVIISNLEEAKAEADRTGGVAMEVSVALGAEIHRSRKLTEPEYKETIYTKEKLSIYGGDNSETLHVVPGFWDVFVYPDIDPDTGASYGDGKVCARHRDFDTDFEEISRGQEYSVINTDSGYIEIRPEGGHGYCVSTGCDGGFQAYTETNDDGKIAAVWVTIVRQKVRCNKCGKISHENHIEQDDKDNDFCKACAPKYPCLICSKQEYWNTLYFYSGDCEECYDFVHEMKDIDGVPHVQQYPNGQDKSMRCILVADGQTHYLHRNHRPAVIKWNKNGKITLEEHWFCNMLNNPYTGGSARRVYDEDGVLIVEEWYSRGIIQQREARTHEGRVQTDFKDGKIHCEEGPAIRVFDTVRGLVREEYWIDGEKLSEEQWEQRNNS